MATGELGRRATDEEKSTGKQTTRGKVRRARVDDLEAIIDINDNVYDGLDYFPVKFEKFLDDERYAIYVFEMENGKLASLCNFEIHSEVGDLVAINSLRVRPSLQGQGFGRPEANPITDQFRREHPNITRYLLQTQLTPKIQAKLDQGKIGRLLYRWNFLLYKLPENHRFRRIPDIGANPTTAATAAAATVRRPVRLSPNQGTEWLDRSDQLTTFLSQFADEYIVVGDKFAAIQLSRSQLKRLFTLSTHVFASFECPPDSNPTTGANVPLAGDDEVKIALDGRREILGFSCSGSHPCKYGLRMNIHYFGNDEDDLLSHVRSHWRQFADVIASDVRVALWLSFPHAIAHGSAENRLRSELGERCRNGEWSAEQFVQYMSDFGTLIA